MILRRNAVQSRRVENCHEGRGVLWFTELLADYRKTTAGFKYIHDNVLEPGASIGAHTHHGDEELYVFLTGWGVMVIDGVPQDVQAGDVCLTRHGHSHDLTNSAAGPMHFLVITTQTGEATG
ncbi:MAG: cupin domain-containing protein [Phycisphaerae bacterium]|nr:cupin domain-containing protein [Phycisphaerae bacterium]